MKDFTLLQEYITKNGNVKTKDALALGYSNYDLKVFMNNSLLIHPSHGIYTLPLKEQENHVPTVINAEETENVVENINPSNHLYLATKSIVSKDYDTAEKLYKELQTVYKENEYYDFCLSYVAFLKQDYQSAYELIVSCLTKNPNFKLIMSVYLILQVLKNYVDIDENILASTKDKIDPSSINIKFLNKVFYPIERANYPYAEKNLYYFVQGDKKEHKFRIGNQYLLASLLDIMKKQGLDTNFKKSELSEVVVPAINPTQILTNTILLNTLENHDYETAYRLLDEYEITDAKEIILSLIQKLEAVETKGHHPLSVKTKVVSEVDAVTYLQPTSTETISPSMIASPRIKEVSRVETKKESDSAKVKELIAAKHHEYKELIDQCNFAAARKALIQYDMLLRNNFEYRNLSHHYERLNRYEQEYAVNSAFFLARRENYKKAIELYQSNNYEEVINLLSLEQPNLEINLLIASAYIALDNFEEAENILKTIDPNCQDPNYFRRWADISYHNKKYSDTLAYCFKFNECRPHRSASIYILMADCYEKLRKPGKAIKALRIANAINEQNGYHKDLTDRINLNAQRAEKNRIKRLTKQNKNT